MSRAIIIYTTALPVFFLTVILIVLLLPCLKKIKMEQKILEIGPSWHKSKEGTPTMGGVAPACAVLTVGLLFLLLPTSFSSNEKTSIILTLLFAFANSTVGLVDDITKFRHKENAGLTPLQKLVLQIGFSVAYVAELYLFGLLNTDISLPGTNISFPVWLYFLFAVLYSVGIINFANLTDGIDGLATTVNFVIGGFFCAFGFLSYLNDTMYLGALMFAASLAFLLFNYHPARIFMGDTGSLFFGAMAIGCAFVSGNPLILMLPGVVYFIEGLSVIFQVAWFKMTKGKRLFKMAPMHHHLEKSGWSEEKIVFVFALFSIIGAISVFFI